MSRTFTVQLEKPITSVQILDDYPAPISRQPRLNGREAELSGGGEVSSAVDAAQINVIQDLEAQKDSFSKACRTLNGLVDKLNQFCDEVFAGHREQIAGLSVEIARKILVQKVQKGDYEIESIVKEALKNAPTRQDVVVHLNPEDFVQCQKAQQDDPASTLGGIRFVSDPNIGRAQCLLETGKGIIESLIDEQLERIGKALGKVG